jgi:ABC-type transport system substrate-binding protein
MSHYTWSSNSLDERERREAHRVGAAPARWQLHRLILELGSGPGAMGPNAEIVFHSRSIPPNAANFGAARNSRIDQLIDTLLLTTDTARVRTIWAELEQLMIDDAVYAPIYMDPELFAVNARIKNVRFGGVEWVEDAPNWYVESAKR